jgi:hypothetical protein
VLVGAASKLCRRGLLAFREEAVEDVVRLKVVSDDRPRWVGGKGDGALAYACALSRGVKRGEAAVLSRTKP